MYAGKSVKRVDALDKVTGRAKYTDDLCYKDAYIARVIHSDIAHGKVISFDISEAEKVKGVIKILTCFDLKEKHYYATPGHPYELDPEQRDVEDRLMLTDTVRYYGDDIGAVVAENEVAAEQALKLIKVRYEEYPFVLDVREAMKEGAPQIHKAFPGNILAHSTIREGNYEEAIKEPGLIKTEGWYEIPMVQHCHMENQICYAEMHQNRIHIVTSTQVPHAVRRIVAQALGMDWGSIRVVKPYVGGGFGNKHDIIYEPLCAWICKMTGGHAVKLDVPREETFVCTRVRHGFLGHLISWVRPDGSFAARKLEAISDTGAYASHGHAVCLVEMSAFKQLYPCENTEIDGWTVFTNKPAAGAMRGYGVPQMMWALERHTDEIASAIGMEPVEFRNRTLIPVGYKDDFAKREVLFNSHKQCLDKAMTILDYEKKRKEYMNQTGNIRRGIGAAVFWFDTGTWPALQENSSCRMALNGDGSIQVQMGETEIGQGADTVFAQMAADASGVRMDMVHLVSFQDTDITPVGLGAYGSRQTYAAGYSIRKTGTLLKEKILKRAAELLQIPESDMDIIDGEIISIKDGAVLKNLGSLAKEIQYSRKDSTQLTAESTAHISAAPYTFGCTVAEVEVDIALCKIKLINIVNCHDAGVLINPALAQAQVHGGMSMGIGYGLHEKLIFDQKTGRTLNNNLLDYKLPTILDHPSLQAEFIENPEPESAFGAKGLGEPPVCSVAPAIGNAVYSATGVSLNRLPMDPHELYKAFSEAGLINDSERQGSLSTT